MEILSFSEFQKEIEGLSLKNPKTHFSFRSIKIVTRPYFYDILFQVFMSILCGLFIIDITALFFSVIGIGFFCYFFYFNFIGLGICEIDFNNKTIFFKNRIFLLNISRKWFGIKTKINFADLKEISCKEGLLLDRFSRGSYDTRYQLLIETHEDPPVVISQFKTEKEADAFAGILKKFLLNNQKIIA